MACELDESASDRYKMNPRRNPCDFLGGVAPEVAPGEVLGTLLPIDAGRSVGRTGVLSTTAVPTLALVSMRL